MKKVLTFILIFVLACLTAVYAVGCKKDDQSDSVASESSASGSFSSVTEALALDKSSLEIRVGENAEIKANTDGVQWDSEDNSVAVVVNGVVTAISVGNTKIIARKGDDRAECSVTVKEKQGLAAYPTLQFSAKVEKVLKGYSFNSDAYVMFDGKKLESVKIAYSSSDENIVLVSKDGVITAVNVGVATITAKATYDGKELTETIEIKVVDGLMSVSYENVENEGLELAEDDTFTVNAELMKLTYNSDGQFVSTPMDADLIEWESENEEIAAVTDGTISARSIGVCTVYSKYDGEVVNSISIKVLRNVFTFEKDTSRISVGRNIESLDLAQWAETDYDYTELHGKNALKVSGITNIISEFSVDFGRKLKAGTVISFDLLTTYTGSFVEQDGWFWLMINGKDMFDGTFTDFTYVIWRPGFSNIKFTLDRDIEGVVSIGFNLGRSVDAANEGYKNFVFYVDNIGVNSEYVVKTYTQINAAENEYRENQTTANGLNGSAVNYSEEAKNNTPDGYVLNLEKSVLRGVNNGSLEIEVYYDLLPPIDGMDGEGNHDLEYLSKDSNCGTFDLSIINYEEEGITAPENGGSKGIKLTNSSTGYPVFKVSLGQTFAAGSTLSFDFACLDPNGATGHFGLIVNGTWYDLNNQGCYHWDLSGKWAHYSVTLAADTDTLSLGGHVGSGTFAAVSDLTAVKFYFDNIKVSETLEFSIKTATQKDSGGYSIKRSTAVGIKGGEIDYTQYAIDNMPEGYVINESKSKLVGLNDGTLEIVIYYDKQV